MIKQNCTLHIAYLAGGAGDHGAEGHGDAHVPVRGVLVACHIGEQVERRRGCQRIAPPDYVRDQPGQNQGYQASVLREPEAVLGREGTEGMLLGLGLSIEL